MDDSQSTLKTVIQSQYLAALEMLRRVIAPCPDSLWLDATSKNRYWHVAYHALFYTHLYLHPTEADFVAWQGHRPEYNFLGPLPWPPHREPAIGQPYTKQEVLDYIEFVKTQVGVHVPRLDLHAPSGFDWLPFGKLELQLYSIRHIMLHVGELGGRLMNEAEIEFEWVGIGNE